VVRLLLECARHSRARLNDVDQVRVIQDRDPAEAGDDFLRVSCEGDESTGVFTVIERVVGHVRGAEATGGWRLRRLFDGLLASHEAALALAEAYARHKGVPVVYAQSRRR
jgi:hypothetical protein